MSDLSDINSVQDAHYEQFTWLAKSPGYATAAETTYDVATGISIILEMIEASDTARASQHLPIANVTDCGALMRFAVSSLRLLAQAAENEMEAKDERDRTA